MLTPYLPYPLWSGGQIRTYNLLKNLSKKHEITLFSFIRDESEKNYIPKLREYCIDVKVFSKKPPWSLTSLSRSAVTFYPLVVCMYLRKEVNKAIAEAIEKRHFDLIHAETFYVMPNIPTNDIPTILVEQTIEYLVYQHYTKSVTLLPLQLLMKWDVAKIRYWEKQYWEKATRVVAMSETDQKVMQKLVPSLTVDLVPNGVDCNYFTLKESKNQIGQTVLFVGNFKWLQNREAVSILLHEIWPIIRQKLPSAKLWIVGRFPPESIRKLNSESILVSENIEDILTAYRKSDVLLAPIYGPGGTRYKILESMATGLPVVTTPTGIEGLGINNEVHALICKDKQELAEQTVRVLTNHDLYLKLAIQGRKLVEDKFNWGKIANSLDRIYKEAAHRSS